MDSGHKFASGAASGQNLAFGRNKLFELIMAFGHVKPILIVRINSLDGHTSPNGLIGLAGCCIIGLIDLLALSKHWLNGLVDFLGCNDLVGFIGLGLVGFIGLSLVSLSGISGISGRIGHNGTVGLVGFIGLV